MEAPATQQAPHPLAFDVAYPERLSRITTLFRLILAIPQMIVAYLLLSVLGILSVIAWFAVLFTGRYPKAFFDFNVGIMRWSANVGAYVALLRDEYPPFSMEPGEYPVVLSLERAERQSRFRLFIRWFAAFPNYFVLSLLSIAWFVTTMISWFAVLISGRYPRGLFKFSVGVQRWYHRYTAYAYLLRDEYPPYSINANARPGNEVLSAIIGVPIGVAYIGFLVFVSLAPLLRGSETTIVSKSFLDTPGVFTTARPAVESGDLRITIAGMTRRLACPGVDPSLTATCFSVDVEVEKDGWRPAFYTPYLFYVEYCFQARDFNERSSPLDVDGTQFRFFIRDGTARSTLYFELGSVAICELGYFTGSGTMRFRFE
jgi:hypothetical protein